MKQKIQELMAQVGTDTSGKWMSVDHAEKFAELIVEECISITNELVDRNADGTWTSNELYTDYNGALFEVKRQIKEHFGVKE